MTTAQFGGIIFDDEALKGFSLSRLIGWYDAAPSRYEADDRPQGHGTFGPGKIYRGARVVSLQGSWSGDDLVSAYQARDQLAAIQADGLESPFVVNDALGSRWINAGVNTAPTSDDGLYQPYFKFAFDVIASDPFKYGAEIPVPTGLPSDSSGLVWPLGSGTTYFDWGTPGATGRALIRNDGTAETYPVIDVTGGLDGGVQLTWVPTGDVVRLERAIPATSVVTFDARTGRVTIDGDNDITGFLTRSSWWSVPPGTSGEIQFNSIGAVTGTPTLTARIAPAYV